MTMITAGALDFTPVTAPGVQSKPASPDELIWLDIFDSLYAEDAQAFGKDQEYYDGDQEIVWNQARFQEIFGSAFSTFRDNWCETVVDACAERLVVIGFNVSKYEEEATDPELEYGDTGTVDVPVENQREAQVANQPEIIPPAAGDPYADGVPIPSWSMATPARSTYQWRISGKPRWPTSPRSSLRRRAIPTPTAYRSRDRQS